MPYLKERGLDTLMRSLTQPFLGICLGMQLMCRHSEEGDTPCLGMFDIDVKRFPAVDAQGQRLKTPHMGWNQLYDLRSPLMQGLDEGDFVYFVHSYYAEPAAASIATCHYGLPFSAALHRDNFYGVQFHTEKSAAVGEKILRNFLAL
jgi:glutamine amidotransferase